MVYLDPEQEYVPLERIGNEELYERVNNWPVATNDTSRKIEPLQFIREEKDAKSYQCFYCSEDREQVRYDGADNKYFFFDVFLNKL